MTAEPATYPTTMTILEGGSPRRPDPVRARVTAASQTIIHSQGPQLVGAEAADRSLHLPPDTRNGNPRRLHPGDILYWVACLGGAGLLILCATT
jgi:hypothetical protein